MEQINQKVKAFLRHYVKYQQNNWTEWLVAMEFQYNDKRYMVIVRTPFKLNFGRYSWKENLTIQIKIPKLEDFLSGLQRSWEEAMKLINMAKKTIKKQFDKKKKNPQGLKIGDNVWLKAKNIYSK